MTTFAVKKFPLGQLVITRGALFALLPDDVRLGLARHWAGDWGELDEHDRMQNEAGLAGGFRLFSRYTAKCGTVFYVITEHDRSVTMVLLPEEY